MEGGEGKQTGSPTSRARPLAAHPTRGREGKVCRSRTANTSEGASKGVRANCASGRKYNVDPRQQCRTDLTNQQGMSCWKTPLDCVKEIWRDSTQDDKVTIELREEITDVVVSFKEDCTQGSSATLTADAICRILKLQRATHKPMFLNNGKTITLRIPLLNAKHLKLPQIHPAYKISRYTAYGDTATYTDVWGAVHKIKRSSRSPDTSCSCCNRRGHTQEECRRKRDPVMNLTNQKAPRPWNHQRLQGPQGVGARKA